MRVCADAGREVLDGHDFMFVWTWQEGLGERDDIQPLILREAKQPVGGRLFGRPPFSSPPKKKVVVTTAHLP